MPTYIIYVALLQGCSLVRLFENMNFWPLVVASELFIIFNMSEPGLKLGGQYTQFLRGSTKHK